MPTVKVGLDQWVLTSNQGNKQQVHLVTSGLSGCVALALASKKQRCLAHVFSDCNEKNNNFRAYAEKLKIPLESMREENEAGEIEAALVYSEGTNAFLPDNLSEWLREEMGVKTIDRFNDTSGCRVSYHKIGNWRLRKKEQDGPEYYGGDDVVTASAAGVMRIDGFGKLSDYAADAGEGDADAGEADAGAGDKSPGEFIFYSK
ncbi:MAG: hypothetical protein JO170_11515 [Verrucomicrobia bacterium]|nr:hypothetical protein [Verrucomicrobiota bacterium]